MQCEKLYNNLVETEQHIIEDDSSLSKSIVSIEDMPTLQNDFDSLPEVIHVDDENHDMMTNIYQSNS